MFHAVVNHILLSSASLLFLLFCRQSWQKVITPCGKCLVDLLDSRYTALDKFTFQTSIPTSSTRAAVLQDQRRFTISPHRPPAKYAQVCLAYGSCDGRRTKMALSFSRITLILLLASFTTALQVSPNSPCASVCLDNSNSDPSSPSSSNTYSSDISCNDADYNSTAVGKKFQACLSCLQTSTFSATPEVDQLWFIYNLRFTVDCRYNQS